MVIAGRRLFQDSSDCKCEGCRGWWLQASGAFRIAVIADAKVAGDGDCRTGVVAGKRWLQERTGDGNCRTVVTSGQQWLQGMRDGGDCRTAVVAEAKVARDGK
jgi:hypothetical protein